MPAKSKPKAALKEATPKSSAYVSVQEQQEKQEMFYSEALRYMENAKAYLKQAQKDGNYFRDTKYVRTACGTAYSGVLIAMEGYLVQKGIHVPENKKVRKSIEYFQSNLAKLNRKMLDNLNSAYKILHLYGYYDGIDNVVVVNEGFSQAKSLIETIKPAELNGSPAKSRTVPMKAAGKAATISNKKKPSKKYQA